MGLHPYVAAGTELVKGNPCLGTQEELEKRHLLHTVGIVFDVDNGPQTPPGADSSR